MKNLPLKLALFIIGLGLLSLIGWYYTIPILTHISSKYLPIALLSSVLFIFSGSFYSIYFLPTKNKFLISIANSLASISLVITVIAGIDFIFIPQGNFETIFYNWFSSFKSVENNELISPISIALFFGSSLSFLLYQLKPIKQQQLFFIKMFFYIEFIISCGFLLVYIENISSFYLNDVYSLAFPTSIGLFILSILHLFMLKFQIWPLNIVDQNSIQSKLVRSFLPIILFFIIIGNAIESHLIAENSENFTNSLLLFILIVFINMCHIE